MLVVNKSDHAAHPEAELLGTSVSPWASPVHAVSAVAGAGLDALDPYLEPGGTVALLGSSGVGNRPS